MNPTLALAGRPNTGKTTLFNALTGMRQRVANFSGTTVERAVGLIELERAAVEIVDLPGTCSILPLTHDEWVAFDYLKETSADGNLHILCVAEASNLENDLTFALALKECGYDITLVVNMIDEAVLNGVRIDRQMLEKEIGIKVIFSSARTGQGLKTIENLITDMAPPLLPLAPVDFRQAQPDQLLKIHQSALRRASAAASRCVRQETAGVLPTISKAIALDRWLFHPMAGPLILALTLFLVFQALFTISVPFRDIIAGSLSWLADALRPVLPGLLGSLLCDGIIAGISAVAQFVPQIALLFTLIGFLEQSGYLPRAGAMVDRALRPFGLDGKVFIPFLSSFACAIPGVMATRTIANEKRRLTAIFLSPLMTCSARIPVYTLIIGAFIPNGYQGTAMAAMYIFGILMALLMALALKNTSLYEASPSPITILPPYRFPKPLELARYVWTRCRHFITKAGKIIFLVSLLLWALASFPKNAELTSPAQAIEYSLLGRLGKTLEPVFRPIGYDWKLSVGIVASLAAREVFVGTLGTLFAMSGETAASEGLLSALRLRYSLATAISLLIFFAIAMQCISTIAVVRRETGGWKWPAIQFTTFFVVAYSLAWTGFTLTNVLIH